MAATLCPSIHHDPLVLDSDDLHYHHQLGVEHGVLQVDVEDAADLTFSKDLALFRYHADMSDTLRRDSACSSSSSTFSSFPGSSDTPLSLPGDDIFSYFSGCESPMSTFTDDLECHPHQKLLQMTQPNHIHYHTPAIARYDCIFADCTWATDRRDLVKDHIARAHRAVFACTSEGCTKYFTHYASLEAHQIHHQFLQNQYIPSIINETIGHYSIGLGLSSNSGLTHSQSRQEFDLGIPSSLSFPRRASESDVGIRYPSCTPSFDAGMPTVYEDEAYTSPQVHSFSSPYTSSYPTPPLTHSGPSPPQSDQLLHTPGGYTVSEAVFEANTAFQQAIYHTSPIAPTSIVLLDNTAYNSVLGDAFEENLISLPSTSCDAYVKQEFQKDVLSPLAFKLNPLNTARLPRRGSEASYFASHPRFVAHPYSPHSGRYLSSPDLEHSRAEKALAARRPPPALRDLNRRRSIPSPIIISGAKTRLHPCDFEGCERVFKRLEHKRRHERSHTQEKPYGCDIAGCGRFFSRSDNLTQHKRTHKRPGRTQKVTQANLFSAST